MIVGVYQSFAPGLSGGVERVELVYIGGRRWGAPELCKRVYIGGKSSWGVPELCTRRVYLVLCTLACFANGGGPKVGRSAGQMADIEGTFKFAKLCAQICCYYFWMN